eukprot:TRINITY_DN22400_c0_g1_i1.p1 TRINITY_DN22400_c0_g1~~TRINITY_DN22400_c0_g1_i1.p1  ORF type:complete len:370 (-),score=54.81 TRINITY_DN22400_c0_g1_i1:20-1129(-)
MESQSAPHPEEIRVQRRSSTTFRCAIAETQGGRDSYEDAHSASCAVKSADFWILDGHKGAGAARLGAVALGEELGQPVLGGGRLPPDDRIRRGFRAVDNKLRKYFKQNPAESRSGSTVVGALVVRQGDGTFSAKIVNCGDSRGLVVQPPAVWSERECKTKKAIIAESIDHKPEHPVERDRIKKAGGFVSGGKVPRVDGRLSVSRGIGDFEFKNDRRRDVSEQKISAVPDVYEVSGLQPGSLLILACDGLWSVISSRKVTAMVLNSLLADPNADLGQVASKVVQASQQAGSQDNVTVLIAQMSPGLPPKAGLQESVVESAVENQPKDPSPPPSPSSDLSEPDSEPAPETVSESCPEPHPDDPDPDEPLTV